MNIEESLRLALAHHNRGELQRAAEIYRQVLAVDGNQPDAMYLLGAIAQQSGDHGAAVELVRRAIAVRPGVAEYFYQLGLSLKALQRSDEAMAAFGRAAALPTANVGLLRNAAISLGEFGRFAEAEGCLRRALAMRPEDAETLDLLSINAGFQGRFGEALESARKAVELSPQSPLFHCSLGLLLLRNGEFAEGWAHCEWRNRVKNALPREIEAKPTWDGGNAAGRTLLIYAEGGHGDAIQYARFVPLVRGRAGRVVVQCHRGLAPLFGSLAGVDDVIPQGAALPSFEVRVGMSSLPYVFGTTAATLPKEVPYLTVAAERVARWAGRVKRDGRLNVGLCWAGNREFGTTPWRSCTLMDFLPLAKIGGVRFHSLQVGEACGPGREAFAEFMDDTADLRDWADTAALVGQLDLVVSVDTGVAHLAGALGRRVWLLTPFNPGYPWLLGGTQTPWYPTMRLFRQPAHGDWLSPVAAAAEALAEFG